MISEAMRKRNNYQKLVKVGYRKKEAQLIRGWRNEKVEAIVKDAENLGKDRVIVLLKEFENRITDMLNFYVFDLEKQEKREMKYQEKYLPEKFNVHIEGHLKHIQDLEKVVELQRKEFEYLKSLKVETKKKKTEIEKLKGKIEELYKELEEANYNFKNEQKEKEQLEDKVKELRTEIIKKEEKIEELNKPSEDGDNLKEEYDNLINEYYKLLPELDKKDEKIEELEKQVYKLELENDFIEKERKRERNNLQTQINQLKKKVGEK